MNKNWRSTAVSALAVSLMLMGCGGGSTTASSSAPAEARIATAATIAAHSGTPLPVITGPIAVTADSYPFGAADHTLLPEDLKKHGYIEEEYFASGTANVYDWPAPGPAVM